MCSSHVLVMILGMRKRRGHAPIGTPRIVRLRHDACSWPYVLSSSDTTGKICVKSDLHNAANLKACWGILLIWESRQSSVVWFAWRTKFGCGRIASAVTIRARQGI